MVVRYYLREVGTNLYYFLFRGEEGFILEIEEAYIFNSRNDAISFLQKEEESELFEGRAIEIVELFCF